MKGAGGGGGSAAYNAYQDVLGRGPTQDEANAFQQALQQALAQGETPAQARSALAQPDAAAAQVDDVWEQVLGRHVDATGLASAETMLASGATLGDLRSMAAQSTEATGDVNALYQQVLGRNALAPELAWFQGQAEQGQAMPAVLAGFRANLAGSAEAAGNIQNLFQAVLGRPATQQDITYWTGQIEQGTSLAGIRQAFAQSTDAANAIQGMFQGVLGRPAAKSDIDYWTGQLAQGGSVAGVRLAFAQSPSVQASLNGVFQGVLRRDGQPDELASYTNALATGQPLYQVLNNAQSKLANSAEATQDLNGLYAQDAGHAPDPTEMATAKEALADGTPLNEISTMISDTVGSHSPTINYDPSLHVDSPDFQALASQFSPDRPHFHSYEFEDYIGDTRDGISVDAVFNALLKNAVPGGEHTGQVIQGNDTSTAILLASAEK